MSDETLREIERDPEVSDREKALARQREGVACPRCRGWAKVLDGASHFGPVPPETIPCYQCGGTGRA